MLPEQMTKEEQARSPQTIRKAEEIYKLALMMMAGERHTRAQIISAIAEKIEEACRE